MIYEFIIFGGGIVCGYVLTVLGYSDIIIENAHKKYVEHRAKNTKSDRWLLFGFSKKNE